MPGVPYQLRMALQRMDGKYPSIVWSDFKLNIFFEDPDKRLIPEIESNLLDLGIKLQLQGEIECPRGRRTAPVG